MLKGYATRATTRRNTDYGDNYNERAGGLDDLNTLLEKGKKWNASFGVHVNATEIYPEAKSFSDDARRREGEGLELARPVATTSTSARTSSPATSTTRIQQAARRRPTDNLDFVYVDVYYQYGWLAAADPGLARRPGFRRRHRVGRQARARTTLWSHWANDQNYGGTTTRASTRRSSGSCATRRRTSGTRRRCSATPHRRVRGLDRADRLDAFYAERLAANLPAKFLQQQEIMRWTPDADRPHRRRQRHRDDGRPAAVHRRTAHACCSGGTYLLPWAAKDDTKVDKLYHYNPGAAPTTWSLTDAFARQSCCSCSSSPTPVA